MKDIIEKELGVEQGNIHVIYNPIQTGMWKYDERVFKPIEGIIKLLLVGTITPLKGGEDLIAACEFLYKRGINVQLTMVGKESDFASKLRIKHKDKKWLDIKGPIQRNVLNLLYDQVDIVCVPSWFENMPMVCIEAMLQGCMLIASNVGGIPEVIVEGETGFMVDAHSPQQLADKIYSVAHLDVKRKEEIAKAAHKRICEKFSSEIISKTTLEYYHFVIENYKSHE